VQPPSFRSTTSTICTRSVRDDVGFLLVFIFRVRYPAHRWSRQAELSFVLAASVDPGDNSDANYGLMAAAPFFFQILLPERRNKPVEVNDASIVVEVSPSIIPAGALTGEREKSERAFAEDMARRTATDLLGVTARDVDIGDSIAQIGELPHNINGLPPALDRGGIRAWKL
jgi:hypothetical protein